MRAAHAERHPTLLGPRPGSRPWHRLHWRSEAALHTGRNVHSLGKARYLLPLCSSLHAIAVLAAPSTMFNPLLFAGVLLSISGNNRSLPGYFNIVGQVGGLYT